MRGYKTADPSHRYLTDKVATASPAELVGMLFDAAVRSLQAALDPAIAKSDFNRHLLRAQDVVMELRCSLNRDAEGEAGQLAGNLDSLYAYIFRRLVDANVRHDCPTVSEALSLLQPLQDAWRRAVVTPVGVAS